MWVKLCGNTTTADVRMCVAAGADAVGFVFAPSRRRVTAEAVGAMALGGLAVERVGVFVSGAVAEIVREARRAELTMVQLHGVPEGRSLAELAGGVRQLAPELRVLPVVHWDVAAADAAEGVVRGMEELKAAGFGRVLLDAKVGEAVGGTGVALDGAAVSRAIAGVRDGMEVVLAGGLRPETVAEAVRVLKPWGVDVASGVEAEPGKKDVKKVEAFVRAARG